MIISTKDGQHIGNIGNTKKENQIDVFNKFMGAMNKNNSPEHIEFTGNLEERPNEVLKIRIKRGSWDIMDAIVPMVLRYIPGDIVEIGMGESTEIFANIGLAKNSF